MALRSSHLVSIILMTFVSYPSSVTPESSCHLGTFKLISGLYQDHRCVDCPNGTFMPQENHQHTKCFDCTKIEDSTLEVLISPCTKSRDADIQCVDGYYRVLARNPRSKPECKECDPCHELLHEIRRCQNYSNTWCCPDVNYDYEYDKQGTALCRERPWMCRKGQYMDTSLNDCKPCPDGTFMSVDYHSYTECWDCQYHSDADLPLHTELIQQCNNTQPAIYSCKEGYYTNHSLSYRGDDIGCLPCKSCSDEMFVGRQCDNFHDTVCCHRPGMQVVDGPGGAQCLDDADKMTSTFDQALSEGKVSSRPVIDKITGKRINDTETGDATKDYENSKDSIVFLLVGLLMASLVINVLTILYAMWLKRRYLSCAAESSDIKFKTQKSVSSGTAVQESQEGLIQNDEIPLHETTKGLTNSDTDESTDHPNAVVETAFAKKRATPTMQDLDLNVNYKKRHGDRDETKI